MRQWKVTSRLCVQYRSCVKQSYKNIVSNITIENVAKEILFPKKCLRQLKLPRKSCSNKTLWHLNFQIIRRQATWRWWNCKQYVIDAFRTTENQHYWWFHGTHFTSKLEVHIVAKVISHKISLTLNFFKDHLWCIWTFKVKQVI